MTFFTTESFPFGDVAMSCASSPSLDGKLVVQRIAFTPTLLDGMTVDIVAAYRILFQAHFPVHDFSFDFTQTTCKSKGDANSGEGLDAQSWSISEGLLMFGTEDGDALRARMPWLEISGKDYPIEYLRNGFRILIPYVGPDTHVGFHFVLVYNHQDSRDDSEWFAVDVPYSRLCEFPVLKQITGTIAE